MGETRGRVPVLAGIAFMALVVGALLGRSQPAMPTVPTEASIAPVASDVSEPEWITVHVSGMVAEPGVVRVRRGSIIADAIAAASGMIAGADVSKVNLAAPVDEGTHIVVPGWGEPGSQTSETGDSGGGGPISLSSASVEELQTLPGVGPVLAERIVSFRDDHGVFETVEDLLQVSGIGEAKLAAIRDLVVP